MASLMNQISLSLGSKPRHSGKYRKASPSFLVLSASQVSDHHNFCCSDSKYTRELEHIPSRRSGNYAPARWDFDFIQSLSNDFTDERYIKRWNLLKEKVRIMLDDEEAEPVAQLELIDDLQRLGVYYHFKDKIQSILTAIHKKNNLIDPSVLASGKDLYTTALIFRLLRQHGFYVSQEVFNRFKDENGRLLANLSHDAKGMLELYEASYHLTENESNLESAGEFAAKNLKEMRILLDKELALKVQHALELPLHWRVPRVEARWFIDFYEERASKNDVLLEFAKLDFNTVQATHQDDLKDSARWWESTCFGKKLSFARDRLMENFFWTVGVNFEPKFGYFRRMSTIVNALITTIDDVYDVYGTLDELELFTDAVERWNVEAIDNLPEYMKICYLALQNAINQMAYNAMKDQGAHIIPYLKRVWADICKCYLQEAKWYHSGYVPSVEEYLENAWVSISAPVILVHAYFFVTNPLTTQGLQNLNPHHPIIRYSAMILRLADDLGTSSDEVERGDVPKSVQCYMKEKGVCEEEARKYIKFLISETWKKLNQERLMENSPFSQVYVGIALNLGRMAQCMYQYGDGHGHSNSQTKDRIRALLFEAIDVSY